MKIRINQICKMEGHAGFEASLTRGDIAKAKLITREGARLIEALLLNRPFQDVPIITSRICGICPVVHNLNSIHAIEEAMGIKVNSDIVGLRKVMQYGQILHSHSLHLYFLSLGNFFNIENGLDLIKKFKKEAIQCIRIRSLGTEIIRLVGGRTVHPINSEVGGFKKEITREAIKKLLSQAKKCMEDTIQLAEFFSKLEYPDFRRITDQVSLHHHSEYGILTGDLIVSGRKVGKWDFYSAITEEQKGYAPEVKRAKVDEKSYFVGALARLNNNHRQLSRGAKAYWKRLGITLPTHNVFHNILAQACELIHCNEEVIRILSFYNKKKFSNIRTEYKVKAGRGMAVMEAPRGVLFDEIELDSGGKVSRINIITPTAQFLNNLEEDAEKFLAGSKRLGSKERIKKIKILIRAYDPCIACATH